MNLDYKRKLEDYGKQQRKWTKSKYAIIGSFTGDSPFFRRIEGYAPSK